MPVRLSEFSRCAGRALAAALLLCSYVKAGAAEVIPPAPTKYFTDYAAATRPETGDRLNSLLEEFEKQTSSQIVVAVFPKMETDSSIEDYSQRIFDAWKPGRANLDQGALLLVFVQDRKLRIHTGYGLEGALPDALCKRIIDDEISPRFRAGDFDGGLTAGVNAILLATRGEYKGTGKTVANERRGSSGSNGYMLFFIVLFFVVFPILSSFKRRKRTIYTPFGRRTRSSWIWAPGSGGGWGSGGGGGFSGGGFSGGGGSSGGGGASGSW